MTRRDAQLDRRRELPSALYTFFFIYLIGWILYGALYFWSMRYHSSDYYDFLNGVADRFRDFSEVNLAALLGDPYLSGRCSNYPPLALLLGKLFSLGYPKDFAALNQWDIRDTSEGDAVFMLVFGICTLLIIILTYLWSRKDSALKVPDSILATIMCLFSAPFIFTIDRGNYIIFAYITFLMFIVTFERNEILSGISLALCACLKIYPVIFILVFLFEKKFKGFWTCIITGIIGLIVPFFFFEGNIIDQFSGFLKGCFGFSDAVLTFSNPDAAFAYVEQKSNSVSNILRSLAMLVFYKDSNFESRLGLINILEWSSKIFVVFLIFLMGYIIIANKDVRKRLLTLVIFTILIPGNTFNYMLLFLHPFIIWFCIKPDKYGSVYVALLTLISIIPKNWYYFKNGAPDVSIECVLNPLLIVIVLFVLAWDTRKTVKRGTFQTVAR